MKKIVQVRILEGVALLGSIGAMLVLPSKHYGGGSALDSMKGGDIGGGFVKMADNALGYWPLTIGLPAGTAVLGKVVRPLGTPKIVVGPISIAAY